MEWVSTATAESFMRHYEKNMTEAPNYREAYEATEAEHERLFGIRKYSSYASFRANRSRLLKR